MSKKRSSDFGWAVKDTKTGEFLCSVQDGAFVHVKRAGAKLEFGLMGGKEENNKVVKVKVVEVK